MLVTNLEKDGDVFICPSSPLTFTTVLFDLDGVLIDSFDAWLQAFNRVLEEQNRQQLTQEEFESNYWGKALHENLDVVGITLSVDDFCTQVFSQMIPTIQIMDQAEEVLSKLDGQYFLGLITNTPRTCVDALLTHAGFKHYFDVIITSDQVEHEKPAPHMITKALNILGVSPECTLYIGDTETDVIAGNNAGCTMIGIGVDAEFTIDHIEELPALLNRISKKIVETSEEP